MSTSDVEVIESSVDALFDIAASEHVLPKAYSRREPSGNTLEGLFIPFGIAVRAIPELANYYESHLGLRRIKDQELVVARRVVEIARFYSEQFIPDNDKLWMRVEAGKKDLPAWLKDIKRPLEAGPGLKIAAEQRTELIARQISAVLNHARQAV